MEFDSGRVAMLGLVIASKDVCAMPISPSRPLPSHPSISLSNLTSLTCPVPMFSRPKPLCWHPGSGIGAQSKDLAR